MDKIYIGRKHDQWRGKPIYVEDEVDSKGYDLILPDVDMKRGNINVISVEFEDSQGVTYAVPCEITSYDNRTINFFIPNNILYNKGTYYAVFTVSYNANGGTQDLDRSAKQSFKILETIEVSDSEIEEEPHYPLLLEMINSIADYKVDTSNFPTFKDLEDIINASMEDVSVEAIMALIKEKGYITKQDVTAYLTNVLINYATKFELGDYAKKLDLYKYVTTNDLTSLYLWHYVKTSDFNKKLETLVEKDGEKTLTSNDFTDELKEKLLGIEEYVAQYVNDFMEKYIPPETEDEIQLSEELLEKINSSISKLEAEEMFYTKEQINELNYTKEQIDLKLEDVITIGQIVSITSFECDIDRVQEVNTNIERIAFSWTTKNISDEIKYVLNVYRHSELIDTINIPYTFTGYTMFMDISDTTTFELQVIRHDEIADIKTIDINFVYPIYYGFVESLTDLYREVATQRSMINNNSEFSITLTYIDSIPFCAIPSSNVKYIADIKDKNGLSYIDTFETASYMIGDKEYLIYYIAERATCSLMEYTFFYN